MILWLLGLLLPGRSLADPKDVAVGVPQVHLTDAPGHIGRGEGDVEALLQAMAVDRVHSLDPDRHPDALVRSLAAALPEGRVDTADAAAALHPPAEGDLARAGADGPEAGRVAPVPALPP